MSSNHLLRINVGFIINLPVGESRDFQFDISKIHLDPDLDLTALNGSAHITRTAQGLLTHVIMDAMTPSVCVRCLSDFDLHLHIDFTELYAFSTNSLTEEGMLLPENAQIDLSSIIREYMLLDIPISPICKVDCKGLCPICGENQNEVTCHHDDVEMDPRLSILRSILDR
ncbi:MAG: YceD family protein [Anaerolineales bacterium]